MSGVHSLDTRRVEQSRQFPEVERFVMSAGLGVTGVERPRGAGSGHLVVATSLAGAHNAIVLTDVEDPTVVYARPTRPGAATITLTVAGGNIAATADGRRQRYSPGTPVVTACSQESEAHVAERMWRCLVRVQRSDLRLSDDDIHRALEGDVNWAGWHSDMLIQTARAARHIKAGPHHPPDPVGVDRHAVGIVELLLRSALDKPDSGVQPTTQDRRRRAERFIEHNLLEPDLNPETVAANQSISLRQLSRIFRDGPGIAATIAGARLDHADRLLRDPNHATMSIAEIARRCRFASSAHFARAYKARHGITPTEARRTGNPQLSN